MAPRNTAPLLIEEDGYRPALGKTCPIQLERVRFSCAWPEATCSAPQMDCYDGNTSCEDDSDFTVTATTTDCTPVSSLESCALTSPPITYGATACEVSGGEAQAASPWEEEVFLCGGAPTGSGCGSEGACLPVDTGQYAHVCIRKPGMNKCPEGWTDQRIEVYTEAEDSRGCSPCACLSPASCATDGSYTVHDSGSCGGSSKTVTSSACVNVFNQTAIDGTISAKLATVVEGECGGGEPDGELVLQGAATICCKP